MLLDKSVIDDLCTSETRKTWLESEDSFPDFPDIFSKDTQLQNEQYISKISAAFQKQMKRYPGNSLKREKWKLKMDSMMEQVLCEETIIGVHHAMDQERIRAFQDELKDVLRHVREFAPDLSMDGIGQAIRNYIVYAMFNEMHQVKPGFRMAGFGYSMLYPFTDNYIDSPAYSDAKKREYNQLIRDKIEGRAVHPDSEHQQKTCDLLSAIESEYPRDQDSRIFTLLLLMLESQEDSLRQQKKGVPLSSDERLDISIKKGGLSVLIDRFLVKKEITKEDLIFYFEFGFFLQLADDLQDIGEDSRAGHQTILTVDSPHDHSTVDLCHEREKIVNKMLHFIHHIVKHYQAENDTFKNFILSNCYQLVYSSVIGSREFFSNEYLGNLEKYFPVTAPFLETMKKNQLQKKDIDIEGKYMKIIDEMIY